MTGIDHFHFAFVTIVRAILTGAYRAFMAISKSGDFGAPARFDLVGLHVFFPSDGLSKSVRGAQKVIHGWVD